MQTSKLLSLFITILIVIECHSQNLTAYELTSLLTKSSWEEVNKSLSSRGWEYHESDKNVFYSRIIWSLEKDRFTDKAQAWFYLYTYDNEPNQIEFLFFNKDSYNTLLKTIQSNGFNLTDNQIKNDEIRSTYTNSKFILTIVVSSEKDSDYYTTTTNYRIILIKKGGILDKNNGVKKEYFSNGSVEYEYNLTDGELNGPFKTFYINGEIKRTGFYVNGEEQGQFKEYDNSGQLEFEYTMKNGEIHGEQKMFNEGKLVRSVTYREGEADGPQISYYYKDEQIRIKEIGENRNGLKNGVWKLIYVEDDKSERVLSYHNYNDGIKNGLFQEASGDSLIVGEYSNDQLNGEYRVYLDLLKILIGGVINTDTSSLQLCTQGQYRNGLKTGHWKYFDLTKTLRLEGDYSNDLRSGEWKYYYSELTNLNSETLPYSGELFLIEEYIDGKLNGTSTRYSSLSEKTYLCSQEEKLITETDSCTKYEYSKYLEKVSYKNDKLDGPYIFRDKSGIVISKGDYKNNQKEGFWIHRKYINNNDSPHVLVIQKGNYKNGKKEGEWNIYNEDNRKLITLNYEIDYLNGEYLVWGEDGEIVKKKIFAFDSFNKLIIYRSGKESEKYEFKNTVKGIKCYFTKYKDDGSNIHVEYLIQTNVPFNHESFEENFNNALNGLSKNYVLIKSGVYKEINPSNQPILIGSFTNNLKSGTWSEYYYSQNAKINLEYLNGELNAETYYHLNDTPFSGEFIFIDEQKNTKEVRRISDGYRNGKTLIIELNTNNVLRKDTYKKGLLKN